MDTSGKAIWGVIGATIAGLLAMFLKPEHLDMAESHGQTAIAILGAALAAAVAFVTGLKNRNKKTGP